MPFELPATNWQSVQNLPGILPTRQRRSQETTVALLEAGAEALRDCAFDELPINDLCAKVGATIGAFYGRFESKDAFFNALVELMVRQCLTAINTALSDDATASATLSDLCRQIVSVIVHAIHHHEGVLRAAMQYKTTHPSRWGKVRDTAHAILEVSTPLLLARMGHGRTAAKTRTIGFAFQLVFGTLINGVLNKPKPVALEDAEMVDRLALVMYLQLDHEARGGRIDGPRRMGRAQRNPSL